MRSLIESDSVWIAREGGSPWTVIAVERQTATIAQPGLIRTEPQSALKLVSSDAVAPSLPICPDSLPAMVAFAQAYPKLIDMLDLADTHKSQLQQKLAESAPLPKPVRLYPNGSAVFVQVKLTGGSFSQQSSSKGIHGIVCCFDPRDNSYTVEVKGVDRLLCCKADRVSLTSSPA